MADFVFNIWSKAKIYRFQEGKQTIKTNKYKENHTNIHHNQTTEIYRFQNLKSAWEEQQVTYRQTTNTRFYWLLIRNMKSRGQ